MHTYRKRYTTETAFVIEQVREDGAIRRVDSDHAGYVEWAASNVVPEVAYQPPSLESLKAAKLAEIRSACEAGYVAGVLTSSGLTMMYAEKDLTKVDGVIRFAELQGLDVVPLLVEADGTTHTDITVADGKAILAEMFAASLAAYQKLALTTAAIEAATTAEQMEAVTWGS